MFTFTTQSTSVCPPTSWTLLLAFLVFLPLGELTECLVHLLKFADEELDVIKDVVQDLLPK